ncbi:MULTISPECIES: alpha/beta hydrolase [unclassified Streptomyces]|uniref:alpha/beta hydrolase n=1 Tax=unclassified Streptomyces TaxID=2593676 RepID=UPI00099B5AAB|nr:MULTISPECIES: alpha/beta hydrolase [unclassified Streptomyces]
MTGVVLVHGLYHDPLHFELVAQGLRSQGITVTVPELHRGSLHADTAAVQATINAMPNPPVVLGHSYGGSVITGLAGAMHLVYIAAFVPDAGESAASIGGATPQLKRAIVAEDTGATHLDPEYAAKALYGDCPPDRAAWATQILRTQLPGCGRGMPQHHAWRHTPSTYVVCTKDQAIEPGLQEVMARRCSDTRFWPTGHSPFISRPDLVINLIRELVPLVSS